MQLSRAEYIKLNIQTKGICVFLLCYTSDTVSDKRITKIICASI